MKNLIIGTVLSVGMIGSANAAMYTFDFEDGINQTSSTRLNQNNNSLDTYMQGVIGRTNFSAGDARWYGSSNTFGSDAIFSQGYASTLDFDTNGRNASNWHITGLQFDWGVFDATPGRDFGLDVYSDTTRSWTNNIFTVGGVGNGATGASGFLDLSGLDVTRIRIHDSGTIDVGLDNLTIWDNQVAQVPEPSVMALIGLGLFGLGFAQRRKFRS